MTTLTINTATNVAADAGYLHNVGRAARALLAALIAVPHKAAAPAKVAAPATAAVRTEKKEVSIYDLYRMAAQYDSVMPNMAQELRAIAARNEE